MQVEETANQVNATNDEVIIEATDVLNSEVQSESVETVPQTEEMQEEITKYECADLHVKCLACGHDEVLQVQNVSGGITIMLPTTDKHKFVLGCPKCNNSIELYWVEVAKPVEAEVVEAIKADLDKVTE
jgi:DNA-directed RNA polymerase subunit M/transcription elongation factor TFIIS